ncbi:hypothetical protein [Leptospira bandrabouensis]|nr:hypothetical protein [Leptospira bandrabouensis]
MAHTASRFFDFQNSPLFGGLGFVYLLVGNRGAANKQKRNEDKKE